jgi:hypothetical protein
VVVGLDDVEMVLDDYHCARRHLLGDDGHLGKERAAFFDGHVEDIGDQSCAEGDFQSHGA